MSVTRLFRALQARVLPWYAFSLFTRHIHCHKPLRMPGHQRKTRVVAQRLTILAPASGSPRSMFRTAGSGVPSIVSRACIAVTLQVCATVPAAATVYQVTNLVSDLSGLAAYTDTNLVNPWGFATSPTGPFWVADNGSGVASIYTGSGQPQALVVTIPTASGGGSTSAPTGVVYNSTTDFAVGSGTSAQFLFTTMDGTISAWNASSGSTAIRQVISTGADYRGLALGSNTGGNFLFAANFASGAIDVFSGNFVSTIISGLFTDPNLPSGYAPFNIQNMGNQLLVTYALQGTNGQIVTGAGNGIVDVFDTNGNLLRRLITGDVLDSPWGLALAPAGFGQFSGDLLVGNFGDGRINAFDPLTGAYQGALPDSMGQPLAIDGLHGLNFGNGANGGDAGTLYFAAGISNSGVIHGLFGSIAAVPTPAAVWLFGSGLLGLIGMARRKILS
jgi:uncharacterized protein (TIGR03118 family)